MKKVYLVSTKEYKAPKCKVVNVQIENVICGSLLNDSPDSIEGDDVVDQNGDWGF